MVKKDFSVTSYKGLNILVTGGRGYIGSSLVESFSSIDCNLILSIGDVSVSKMLLDKRLAVSYNGGTKTSPEDWMKYHSGETE